MLVSKCSITSLLQKQPIILFIDNNRAINMIKIYYEHKKIKHFDI